MDRRDFIKLTAVSGTSAALASCGNPEHQLIRFVPDEDIVPGAATWKPSVCPLCASGCGLTVRVMDADAEVVRNGQAGVVRIHAAKKLEGSPAHPVNQGRLCARGQAAIQVTYHPDRIAQPLKRSGERGDGRYEAVTWDAALAEVVSRLDALTSSGGQKALAYLMRVRPGHREALAAGFLARFGAPPPVVHDLFDEPVLRHANGLSFGHQQLPTLELETTHCVLSFGADFLGTWNSPVAQGAGYGTMRQGRPGIRGRLIQIEPRMSQTGANADQWVPIAPGTEGILALGIAHVIMAAGGRSGKSAGQAARLVDGWAAGLPAYAPAAVEKSTGVAAARIERIARAVTAQLPAVAIAGGAALAHTNGLFTAVAVNALNELLGNAERTGNLSFTPQINLAAAAKIAAAPRRGMSLEALTRSLLAESGPSAEVLFVDGANPVFTSPPAWRVRDALARIPFIVSFGAFLDDTSVLADLILPDHSFLESWADALPESGSTKAVISVAPPAMRPLHDTRATGDVLLEIGRKLAKPIDLPWQTMEEMLGATFATFPAPSAETDAWSDAQEKGGWWGTLPPPLVARPAPVTGGPVDGLDAAVRRRPRTVPATPAAVRLVGVPRRRPGPSAVAAGDARPDHLGDVEQLGRDQSGDGRASERQTRRHRGGGLVARNAAVRGVHLAGNRARRRGDAGGAGAPHLHTLRERERREPADAARPAHRADDRRARLGGDARAGDTRGGGGRTADSVCGGNARGGQRDGER